MVLQERYGASERLVCRVVGQHRSTQRHGGKVTGIVEAKLRHRLRVIAAEHIRWVRRMAYRLLRREGWAGEPQVGATALAGGGPATPHPEKAEACSAR